MGGGGIWGGGGKVEMINGKGCSRRFFDFSSSFRGIHSSFLESMSPASTTSVIPETPVKSDGPLSGLIICVTGLSKETRKQVKEATERLGGQYSPHLHPRCTHLVVQSFHGHKFEHALKHGSANGLFLVTLSWFVDSIRRNVRLNESLYSISNSRGIGVQIDDLKRLDQNNGAENPCFPAGLVKHTSSNDETEEPLSCSRFPERENKKAPVSFLSGQSFYVDGDVPAELYCKVTETLSAEGAGLASQWFAGCNAAYVVCEGPSVRRYIGHSSNLVTPLWVLKSAKEKCLQRLVHLSADLARFTGAMLGTFQDGIFNEEYKRVVISPENICTSVRNISQEEKQAMVNLAKDGVRRRRNRRMQTCQTPIHPITRSRLLDSINWSISEPTSTASIYTDSLSTGDSIDDQTSIFPDIKIDGRESETSFMNLSRLLTESEKSELIFKGHFLTILFPVDRFSEMGPCSRTFFSDKGFTCLQVLDHIYSFYQSNMCAEEMEIAIHTDSRHADRLRAAYSSKTTEGVGFKRIDFLGSRRSFEMLKRISGDNNSNVYELFISA